MIVPPPSQLEMERQVALLRIENDYLKTLLRSQKRQAMAPEIGLDPSWEKRRELSCTVSNLKAEVASQQRELQASKEEITKVIEELERSEARNLNLQAELESAIQSADRRYLKMLSERATLEAKVLQLSSHPPIDANAT